MCYCSFAIGQFLVLRNQSKRKAFELWFKVQISSDHQLELCFYGHTLFCELNSAFNGISHKKLFAVFLPNRWEFLSDYLITYSGQKSKQITDKKIQMSSEIKLLAGTKVYYCFNSIQREIISK